MYQNWITVVGLPLYLHNNYKISQYFIINAN